MDENEQVNAGNVVLSHLISDKQFARQVLGSLVNEYFKTPAQQIIFKVVEKYIQEYGEVPNKTVIQADISKQPMTQEGYKEMLATVDTILKIDKVDNLEWLLETTDRFCKFRAYELALLYGIDVYHGKVKNGDFQSAFDTMKNALAVSVKNEDGIDLMEDSEKVFEDIQENDFIIPSNLNALDNICAGGFPKRNLIVFTAPSGVGKTLFLMNIALNMARQGKNVAFFSMETADKLIALRAYANLLQHPVKTLKYMDKGEYKSRLQAVKERYKFGFFKIKEYKTGSVSANDFRGFAEKLRNKGIHLDAIVVDYIGITKPCNGGISISDPYNYYGSIASDLRRLAYDTDTVVLSATQVKDNVYNEVVKKSADERFYPLDVIKNSSKIAHEADFVGVLSQCQTMKKLGQIAVYELKNRLETCQNRTVTFAINPFTQSLHDLKTELSTPVKSLQTLAQKDDAQIVVNTSKLILNERETQKVPLEVDDSEQVDLAGLTLFSKKSLDPSRVSSILTF